MPLYANIYYPEPVTIFTLSYKHISLFSILPIYLNIYKTILSNIHFVIFLISQIYFINIFYECISHCMCHFTIVWHTVQACLKTYHCMKRSPQDRSGSEYLPDVLVNYPKYILHIFAANHGISPLKVHTVHIIMNSAIHFTYCRAWMSTHKI